MAPLNMSIPVLPFANFWVKHMNVSTRINLLFLPKSKGFVRIESDSESHQLQPEALLISFALYESELRSRIVHVKLIQYPSFKNFAEFSINLIAGSQPFNQLSKHSM